jgi:hypothetical protein
MLTVAATTATSRADRRKFVSGCPLDPAMPGGQASASCEFCSPVAPGSSAATWPTASRSSATRSWWSTGYTHALTGAGPITCATRCATWRAAWMRPRWRRHWSAPTRCAIRRRWSGSAVASATWSSTCVTTTWVRPSCWRRSTADRPAPARAAWCSPARWWFTGKGPIAVPGTAWCGQARVTRSALRPGGSSRPARAAAPSWCRCRSARRRPRIRKTSTRPPSCTRSTWHSPACVKAARR